MKFFSPDFSEEKGKISFALKTYHPRTSTRPWRGAFNERLVKIDTQHRDTRSRDPAPCHDRQTRIECYAKIFVRVYRSWRNARVLTEFPRGLASAPPPSGHWRDDSHGERGEGRAGKKEYNFEEDAYGKNDRRGVSTFLQRAAQGKLKLD